MAICRFLGHAAAIAQVDRSAIDETWANADTATVTINSKDVICTNVAGGNTAATILDEFAATLNASTIPEFAEVVWANYADTHLQGTADTGGKPFTVSIASSTADDGTMGAFATAVTNRGPNSANTADNWSTDAMPTNSDDVVFENLGVPCLWDLDALVDIDPLSFTKKQSYTGEIGLPKTNVDAGTGVGSAYNEYRQGYLQMSPTTADIGEGEGTGSGRVKLDFGAQDVVITVHNKGSRAETGIPSVLLKGTNSSNKLTIHRGDVGVAFFDGETASLVGGCNTGFKASVIGDSTLVCGSGVTFGDVGQSGGKVSLANNVATYTQYDGDLTALEAMTITALVAGGVVHDYSTGTFTTVTVKSDGEYDHSESLTPKTIINLSLYDKSKYRDPHGVVTVTNGFDFVQCSPGDNWSVPPNRTWTESAI